eukprot:TRINITY_DN1404_c0_g1_i1.p1 TRINITY_DN1404_c0_g1~~TRINITY_DN1404_c0_g1_i1.p1  ORF type:complete len:679 (+),score=142.47 TRINITY_DN1404_c0_g1_i1:282-2039(+)
MCYNALDRHVQDGRGNQIAIIFDSPFNGEKEQISYQELLKRVKKFAYALDSLGVSKGDKVIIYMPLIPEACVAMLACARIGAIHSVVFGGFASEQLGVRIRHSGAKAVIYASNGFSPDVLPYQPLVKKALETCNESVPIVIRYTRPNFDECDLMPNEYDWNELVDNIPRGSDKLTIVDANDPLYILYTSGTTGDPKGIVRDTGGYMVSLNWSLKSIFGMEPGQIFWAASDIGWVVGHSYILYGPLLYGCTTVIYDGKPVGTPDAAAYWRVIQEYRINCLFAAPTALRLIKKEDPTGNLIKKYDLSSFESLFLAGERADTDTIKYGEKLLHDVPVIDHWWQTETGWPIASNFMGMGYTRFPTKYGSCTKAVPGYSIHVLNDEGVELKPGELGNIAIKLPLPPGTLTTLYKNDSKYISEYLEKFPGYYNSGDAGFIDEDGYIRIMSRVDDIINVGGVRISTGAVEEILGEHPDIAESAVIGPNCELRGQVPVALVVLKDGVVREPEEIIKELIESVRLRLGAIANFKKVGIVSVLPKTRSGKTLRATLKNIANNQPIQVPATIDNPDALDICKEALNNLGYTPIYTH